MANFDFKYDERLDLHLPVLHKPWEELSEKEQEEVLYRWEQIRSQIPERIKALEKKIKQLETQLQTEDDYQIFCKLSERITELASRLIDLNVWFRTHEEITAKKAHQ